MNVNTTKYINILHERKHNKIHRYINKTKYIDILHERKHIHEYLHEQNTSISYMNVNTTKSKHKKIHQYPT